MGDHLSALCIRSTGSSVWLCYASCKPPHSSASSLRLNRGACQSGVDKERAAKSKKLDTMIRKETRALNEEVKILLLGPGESGKSTVFKQMKIIQVSGGFTDDELKQYRFIVFGNCITQMKVLITAAEKLGIEMGDPANKEVAERVTDLPAGGGCWKAAGIQETFKLRDKEFQLNDSAAYFFD